MRGAALRTILGTLLLLAAAAPAHAHLMPSGSTTLIGLMRSADGMLVARAAAETHARDASAAATPFLARETVAGTAPEEGFVLDQGPPILRYAALQDVLLLVARQQEGNAAARWVSVQPAGAGIVLAGATIDDRTRAVLRALWSVAHPAAGSTASPEAAVSALVDALSLPEPKLRALAFLDLSGLADDPQHFSPQALARLSSYGEAAGDDPQLARAVQDLARKLGAPAKGGSASAAATGASKL